MHISDWSSDVCSSDLKGAPLVSVVPRDCRLSAEFLVPLDTAQRVKTGDPVSVTFYAGQKEAGARVERIVLPTFTETNAFATIANGSLKLTAIIRVRFDSRLPVDYVGQRSEEQTSELQSLMRTSYAVFCLKK